MHQYPGTVAFVIFVFLILGVLFFWKVNFTWVKQCREFCDTGLKIAAVSISIVLISIGLFLYLVLPEPVVRTNLRATVERFEFEVLDPINASQRISGMRMRSIGDSNSACVDGLVQPQLGTKVAVSRHDKGNVVFRIEYRDARDDDERTTVANLIAKEKEPHRLVGGLEFSVDSECPGFPPERFAIDGLASFGHEFRPASLTSEAAVGYLSEGKITMFINAIDEFLWFKRDARLIHVESTIVPAGARVLAAVSKDQSGSIYEGPRWTGLATIGQQSRDFIVDVYTNAKSVEILLSGATRDRLKLQVGDFTRVSKDPNIVAFYSVISIFALGLGTLLIKILEKFAVKYLGFEKSEFTEPSGEKWQSPADSKPQEGAGSKAKLLLFAVLLSSGGFSDALALPVRLTVGDQFGQGWMFTDHAGVCRIVTAAHVVQRSGGLVAPAATDANGREFPTSNPVQMDPNLDIAVLTARPAGQCPAGGLGEATAAERIEQSARATLDFLQRTARGTVHLTRRARPIDAKGGETLVFDRAEGPPITQGMSGGAILDANGRPLAIITHTDAEENRAHAVRVDIIATLIRTRLAQPAQSRETNQIAGWAATHGASIDPARGVDQILTGGQGWGVAPQQGYVTIDIRLGRQRTLRSVSLRINDEARGRIGHLQVFGNTGPQRLDPPPPAIGLCDRTAGATDLHCEFAARPVQNLRLQMRITASPVTLSDLQLGFAD